MKTVKLASEMDQGIFSILPPEIILNIFSRIPIDSVFTCRCVCKLLLSLLETQEFARLHLSNSASGWLLVNQCSEQPNMFKIFDIERVSCEHRGVTEFNTEKFLSDLPHEVWAYIKGSVNGLIMFGRMNPEQHYICNPITCERIKLPAPPQDIQTDDHAIVVYGLGVSRSSGQYKVVRLFYEFGFGNFLPPRDSNFVCHVYTLGTKSWRRIDVSPAHGLLEVVCASSTFLNGNLHWLVRDLQGSLWISCFDLEAEEFTRFRAPIAAHEWIFQEIGVLRNCLCICDCHSSATEFVIYRLSCYEKKSWVKECVVRKSPEVLGDGYERYDLINVYGEGDDVLMVFQEQDYRMFCYSNRAKKCIDLINLDLDSPVGCIFQTFLFTPSLVSLGGYEVKYDEEQHEGEELEAEEDVVSK